MSELHRHPDVTYAPGLGCALRGADDGDGYDGVDVFLPCGEAELDSGQGDDLCDGEGASPFVVKLLHGAIRGVILEA